MFNLSISDVLDRAWDLTKKHGIVLCVIYLVVRFALSLLSRLFTPPIDEDALISALQNNDYSALLEIYNTNPTGSLVIMILTAIVMLGFTKCMLMLARQQASSVEFEHWQQPVSVYVKYVVISVAVDIISIIGFICCILPGLYLSARLGFASMSCLDHPEAGIGDCISQSWRITRGNALKLILLQIVQIFLIIIGFLCCCIGVLPAAVVCYFAEVVAYLTLLEFQTNERVD